LRKARPTRGGLRLRSASSVRTCIRRAADERHRGQVGAPSEVNALWHRWHQLLAAAVLTDGPMEGRLSSAPRPAFQKSR
jgi:hypothetical protein